MNEGVARLDNCKLVSCTVVQGRHNTVPACWLQHSVPLPNMSGSHVALLGDLLSVVLVRGAQEASHIVPAATRLHGGYPAGAHSMQHPSRHPWQILLDIACNRNFSFFKAA